MFLYESTIRAAFWTLLRSALGVRICGSCGGCSIKFLMVEILYSGLLELAAFDWKSLVVSLENCWCSMVFRQKLGSVFRLTFLRPDYLNRK